MILLLVKVVPTMIFYWEDGFPPFQSQKYVNCGWVRVDSWRHKHPPKTVWALKPSYMLIVVFSAVRFIQSSSCRQQNIIIDVAIHLKRSHLCIKNSRFLRVQLISQYFILIKRWSSFQFNNLSLKFLICSLLLSKLSTWVKSHIIHITQHVILGITKEQKGAHHSLCILLDQIIIFAIV